MRKAAKRELKEETGIASPPGLIELGFVRKRTGNPEQLHCFIGKFAGKTNPKPRREIIDAGFVALSEAAILIEKFQLPLLTSLTAMETLGKKYRR